MHVTFGEILIWLIVGGLIGSFVGRLAMARSADVGTRIDAILDADRPLRAAFS